jgi:hypothetical protein
MSSQGKSWSKAEAACPRAEHAGSRVRLDGWYGSPEHRRQLYKCVPSNGDPPHRFTELLPREESWHDACESCERDVHANEGPHAARKYQFVARGGRRGASQRREEPGLRLSLRVRRSWPRTTTSSLPGSSACSCSWAKRRRRQRPVILEAPSDARWRPKLRRCYDPGQPGTARPIGTARSLMGANRSPATNPPPS